jgi:predicted HAD superfamily Cof-like phosphohydrolase
METEAFRPERCGLIVADGYDAEILRPAPTVPLNAARRKAEVERLKAREQELIESNSARRREMRGTLREQVREFHEAFGVESPPVPTVPDDETVRLRLRLIAEEFFELIAACSDSAYIRERSEYADPETVVYEFIDECEIKVDLPEFADALADIDYVVEGSRLAFGINGKPIADEVHACNMAKFGGTKREDGKIE